MGFRLVPKLVTLNDVMATSLHYFTKCAEFCYGSQWLAVDMGRHYSQILL